MPKTKFTASVHITKKKKRKNFYWVRLMQSF